MRFPEPPDPDLSEPDQYPILVIAMPAHVYDTLIAGLEYLRDDEIKHLYNYKLLKGRVPDDRLLPSEVNAQKGLELVEEAQNWLEYTMQGLEPPQAKETPEAPPPSKPTDGG